MDLILNRYRNLTVLLVAILAQLVLLGRAASGGEQPARSEARNQRGDGDDSDFQ